MLSLMGLGTYIHTYLHLRCLAYVALALELISLSHSAIGYCYVYYTLEYSSSHPDSQFVRTSASRLLIDHHFFVDIH